MNIAEPIHPFRKILNFFIAGVWLINGLFFKILDWVPRHQEIVANILSTEYSRQLTVTIGAGEVLIAIWVLLGIYSRSCAIIQITLIATMNFIEFFLVPEMLMFGRLNAVFAFLFILLIYFNEFVLTKK